MSQPVERHPDNPPGDFYVECDSCISCEAPYHEAPDLVGRPGSSDNNYGCFFRRQPATPEELDRACDAVMVSCVEAVRYAGNDPDILRKLYDLGSYASCDISGNTATEIEQFVIDHVKQTYRSAARYDVHWTYIHEDTPEGAVVACCYGPYTHAFTLGVFAVDKSTRTVDIVNDDGKYRPRHDHFERPSQSRWRWLPFRRRDAT